MKSSCAWRIVCEARPRGSSVMPFILKFLYYIFKEKICIGPHSHYKLLQISRLDGHFYMIMFVVICSLILFAEVRWSFLCEHVSNCPLFISFCRGEIVLFIWVCYQLSVVYFSMQWWDGLFYVTMLSIVRCFFAVVRLSFLCEYVINCPLLISLCRCEIVLFILVCL